LKKYIWNKIKNIYLTLRSQRKDIHELLRIIYKETESGNNKNKIKENVLNFAYFALFLRLCVKK